MLDEYIWGIVSRNSPEAPIPVVEVEQVSYAPGGVANVAVNITSLKGEVYLAGVIGTDEAAEKLKTLLSDNNVNFDGLKVDFERPTTLKTRIMAYNQQVVRVDREIRKHINEFIKQELLTYILNKIADVDVLLISDYAKGVIVEPLLKRVISAAKLYEKPVVVDPKGRDFLKYEGATIITPNLIEAAITANRDITDEASLIRVGQKLLHKTKCEAILISLGEKGMSLFESNGVMTHLPAVARQAYDVTGAGDTVVAIMALALATGAGLVDCIRIANCAAGIVVDKLGTNVVTIEELQKMILNYS
jgi:D-beta-D-heptose 7-phosphate kinase/D-beta-D-heptose 1-phosphate adenosyltransferase